jgi:hypothetical protein
MYLANGYEIKHKSVIYIKLCFTIFICIVSGIKEELYYANLTNGFIIPGFAERSHTEEIQVKERVLHLNLSTCKNLYVFLTEIFGSFYMTLLA